MAIDFDTFLKWATGHFGDENIRLKGNEILTHTPFTEDRKFHLWMNPSGGKRELSGGAYRCWYTDKKGSLISLVAELDKISYEEAEELLTGTTSLRSLEKQVHDFFNSKEDIVEVVEEPKEALELPPFCYSIDHMSCTNSWKVKATNYLESRKIPTDGLYVCTGGDYKNRIIIPYIDIYGQLIYYNGRSMSDKKSILRYMKPDDETLKQTEVLYCPHWPRPGQKIYLTEGEFDTISLFVAELHSAAFGGKSMSQSQIEQIRAYVPVLAFDNDEDNIKMDTGGEALIENGNKLLECGFREIYYVRPPRGFKDWNALLQAKNPATIREYIKKYEKRYDGFTAAKLKAIRA